MEESKYQIRHKELGVYQGSFLGFGFWHPTSECPEQGLASFTRKDADNFVSFLCSDDCAAPLHREDLSIESFDAVLDFDMTHRNLWGKA